MKKKEITQKEQKPKFPFFKIFKMFLLFLYTVLFFVSMYHIIFAKRIIPGVRVGSLDVGSLTYVQARSKLDDQSKKVLQEIILRSLETEIPIKTEEINLYYDWDLALAKAFQIGRSGDFFYDTKAKVLGPILGVPIDSFYSYDSGALGNKFSMIKGELNKEAISAHVVFENNDLVITKSENGRKVLDQQLYKTITDSFDNVDFSSKEIPIVVVEPRIVEADVEQFMPKIKEIIFKDFKVTYEKIEFEEETKDSKSSEKAAEKDEEKNSEEETKKEPKITTTEWTLDSSQLLDFITFEKDDKGRVKIDISAPKLNAYADTISNEVGILPRGKVTEMNGNKVIKFEITQSGYEVDMDKFKKDFALTFFGDGAEVKIDLKETQGYSDKDKYGILELIGKGESEFHGSIAGRINNLELASNRTDGVLVPPGAVYSMNKTIGEISAKTGYDVAYIIKGGRTVLGEGGGVCQTSTTMFRAALNAGLPIVKRYPHAYRVHYYEENSPVGIDAAIFQPTIDFQFKNDTPNYILIETFVDRANYHLEYRIYGTPDGRSVEMTTPVVTNQTPPPEPLYEEDPNLPKGTVKQIDWAAWGATASFTRTVKRGDEVIIEDTYTTRYQPWRAVYLRGTKED